MANANNAPLKKIIAFYCRFTPSYSKIGYYARSMFWRRLRADFRGQTWLVVGGSEGIGGSAARSAVAGGATVVCVARNADKLRAFAASCTGPGKVICETADFSLRKDVWDLLERLQARGLRVDVLVNNVGIQKRDQTITREGLETSFSTNILSHYLFAREMVARGLLSDTATVIETSSGGNVPRDRGAASMPCIRAGSTRQPWAGPCRAFGPRSSRCCARITRARIRLCFWPTSGRRNSRTNRSGSTARSAPPTFSRAHAWAPTRPRA